MSGGTVLVMSSEIKRGNPEETGGGHRRQAQIADDDQKRGDAAPG
jgi:hypothetical protein